MIMFCVATLTQYWVNGVFFVSAAEAWMDEQMKRTAAAKVVILSRFMIRTSLEKVYPVCSVCSVNTNEILFFLTPQARCLKPAH
jgi:hypothetical protein